jgi:SAM-dependent methyltransferase
VSEKELAERLAKLYERRSLQGYVRWKVSTDPLYRAVFESIHTDDRIPLVDVGCGVGLLAFYLRERGYAGPIRGIDFDPRKIEVAQRAARNYDDVEFTAGDARDPLPPDHNVVLLDILQYFDADSQRRILENAVRAVPAGGAVVLRQAVRDRSWRYRLTARVDAFARTIRWMKAEELQYPTRESIVTAFSGFSAEISPLWGRMPYNNYLFVFRKRGATDRRSE